MILLRPWGKPWDRCGYDVKWHHPKPLNTCCCVLKFQDENSPGIICWTLVLNIILLLMSSLAFSATLATKHPGISKHFLSISSFQFSHSHMSNSLQPHGLQHTRLPCPSPTPGTCSNSCPSSWWCHPTISSSVIPFSSCLQSSPASGSFPMSKFFASGGQSVGALTSASVFSMNIYDWFPLGLTALISLQSKGLSRVLQHLISKASILWCSAFFMVQLSHPYMTTGKTSSQSFEHLSLCPTNSQVESISDYGLYSLPQPLCPESSYRQWTIE